MHNVTNSKMLNLLFEKIINQKELQEPLQELLIEGFVSINNCYFLKVLYERQIHIKASDFVDQISYECFINSIHIDDYVERDLMEQSFLFIQKLTTVWNELNNRLELVVILSETEFGFYIQFHVDRGVEKWVEENELHKFEEGIMILRSSC